MKRNISKYDSLTAKQRRAIPFLAGASSLDEGCRLSGLSRPTLYRWLKDPVFAEALESERREIFSAALSAMKAQIRRAVEKLSALLDSSDENVRLRASDKLISHAVRVEELIELKRRIEELERRLLTGGGR